MGEHHGGNRSGPPAPRRAVVRRHLPPADEERRHEDGQDRIRRLWLDPRKTSPYKFYQYWINLADADVGKCLRFFTDLPREEIDSVETRHAVDPGRREAQRVLAAELTRLVHGDEGLATAQRATEIFFAPRSAIFPTLSSARFSPTSPATSCTDRSSRRKGSP